MMSMMKTFAVDLSGRTVLKEALAVIALCRLFITILPTVINWDFNISAIPRSARRKLIYKITNYASAQYNDSGLMHIAAALNVPQGTIFGSTNFAVMGTWSTRASIVRSTVNCSPCPKQRCPSGHMECMSNIIVDKVFTTACALMTE
jgi:ADP-heptose:LPS heptosyltransferase